MNRMFKDVARRFGEMDRLVREEAAEIQARIDREQARLDEHLTRREVVEAIEAVAKDYGCVGTDDWDLIADAFRKLAEMLR